MKFCPACGDEYPDSRSVCDKDDSLLSLPDPYELVGDKKKNMVDGKYRVERVVGRGGMSVIYCAHQVNMDRYVALKVPLQQFASEEKFTNIFVQEAQLAGRLYHKNIVAIYDCGRTSIGRINGIPYIVMEWLEGITLEQKITESVKDKSRLLHETTPLSLIETAKILRQTATALYAAHQKNIIHRDVKPSNIMLLPNSSAEEQVKLVDFGISKAVTGVNPDTYVTTICGTHCYASPEQLLPGAKIDRTSDIYSLGVMLYQMIAGKLPFYDATQQGLIQKHREEAPPPISEERPEAIVIEKLLLEMMSKSREHRPQNVMEVADRFDMAIRPVKLEGQIFWKSENIDKPQPISEAKIKLHQHRVADQVSNENGYFSFDSVLNVQPFRISVQAEHFERKDYVVKPGQLNQVSLTPQTVELGGRVFAQVTLSGFDDPLKQLGNIELRLEPLGPPARSNLTARSDDGGRFKIRLVGPQLTYIGTPYIIHIDGFQNSTQILTSSEMQIVVKAVTAAVEVPGEQVNSEQSHISCPSCGRSYVLGRLPKFCQGCGAKLTSCSKCPRVYVGDRVPKFCHGCGTKIHE
jgi:serine/threonine protein kinase